MKITTEQGKFIASKAADGWSTLRINEHLCIPCFTIDEFITRLSLRDGV